MTETQVAIQRTIEAIRQIDTVNRRVKESEEELTKAKQSMNDLTTIMDKELDDLNQMESMSVKAVFYKVLGSKEEQLEKERQDYLQASLKFNEQKDKIELLEFELGVLNKKISSKSQLVNDLVNLKKEREQEIISTNPRKAEQLLTLSRNLDHNILKQREINEAQEAGDKCAQTITEIINELKNAQHWGKWDMYGNDGRRAGHMKHTAIDRAKNLANIANHELNKFSKELADTGEFADGFQITMDYFSSFMDVFFDNLITDWIMQQKIVNSLNMMHSNLDKVQRILISLKHKTESLNKHSNQLKVDYDQILLS